MGLQEFIVLLHTIRFFGSIRKRNLATPEANLFGLYNILGMDGFRRKGILTTAG
jgi:hypothetical protein